MSRARDILFAQIVRILHLGQDRNPKLAEYYESHVFMNGAEVRMQPGRQYTLTPTGPNTFECNWTSEPAAKAYVFRIPEDPKT